MKVWRQAEAIESVVFHNMCFIIKTEVFHLRLYYEHQCNSSTNSLVGKPADYSFTSTSAKALSILAFS